MYDEVIKLLAERYFRTEDISVWAINCPVDKCLFVFYVSMW